MALKRTAVVFALIFKIILEINSQEITTVPPTIYPTIKSNFLYKIIGGVEIRSRTTYAFMVSLQYDGGHFCGGTIISRKTVLTAAHCFMKTKEKMKPENFNRLAVMVNTNDLEAGNGIRHAITTIIKHEDYDEENVLNDIAVVILETTIQYGPFTSLALVSNKFIPVGTPATSIGWGGTDRVGRKKISTILKSVDSVTTDFKVCDDLYIVNENILCLQTYPGNANFKGDSGGPVMSGGVQVGIISFGSIKFDERPEVVTRTSVFYAWIQKQIRY